MARIRFCCAGAASGLPRSLVAAVFVLFACAAQAQDAGAEKALRGNYAFDTPQGDLVVPLPEGYWRKVLEHETHEMIDMGTYSESYTRRQVFLAKAKAGGLEGIVSINTNVSDIMGEDLAPPDFCYAKQRTWRIHEQISALSADTYCWGVRPVRLPVKDVAEAEAWQMFMEKGDKAGRPLADDTDATQVRFLRWVNGRFLRIDYYFLGPKGEEPMPWMKARDWAKGLVQRVKRGYEGEAN